MSLCDKNWVFSDGDALPTCQREATHLVEFKYRGRPIHVYSCQPCTSLFSIRKALKATITPLTKCALCGEYGPHADTCPSVTYECGCDRREYGMHSIRCSFWDREVTT